MRPQTGENYKELVNNLEVMYKKLTVVSPTSNALVSKLYSQWLDGQDSDKAQALLHTEYHAVEKMDMPLNIKW